MTFVSQQASAATHATPNSGSATISATSGPVASVNVSSRSNGDHGYQRRQRPAVPAAGNEATTPRPAGTRHQRRRSAAVSMDPATSAAAKMYRAQTRCFKVKLRAELLCWKQQTAYWMRKHELVEKQLERQGHPVRELQEGLAGTDDTHLLSNVASPSIVSEDESDRKFVLHVFCIFAF